MSENIENFTNKTNEPHEIPEHPEQKTRIYTPTLKEIDWRILTLALNHNGKKYSLNQIAEIIKKSKSNVSERISKLERYGYLTKKLEDGFLNIELTKQGKDACSVFLRTFKQDVQGLKIRLHKFNFIMPIVRRGSAFEDDLKKDGNWVLTSHKTWNGFKKNFDDGVTIEVTPKSVRLGCPNIYDVDPEVAHQRAMEYVRSAKKSLETLYPQLILGDLERIGSVTESHYAIEYDPLARLCCDPKINYLFEDERLKVDRSHGFPELEAKNKDYGLDDAVSIKTHYDWLINGGKEKIHDGDIDFFEVQKLIIQKLINIEKILDRYGLRLPQLQKGQTVLTESAKEVRGSH